MKQTILRRETQVALSSSALRYRRSWLPEYPTRVLALVHGFAEHSGRYDEMAVYFADRDFAVHAYDQAGHGRTAGPRGHVDRFDALLEDLGAFLDVVSEEHPDLPITLVGHSMGGLVAAATAAEHAPPIDRLVLSGALLGLDETGGGLRRRSSLAMAGLMSRILPRVGFETGLDPEGISRDPEVVRRYVDDPFVKDRMSLRFAAGLAACARRVADSADRIDHPVLVLHGHADPICSPLDSQRFFADLRPEIAQSSALRIYPELRHEIFNEPEREKVFEDMLGWLGE